MALLTLKFVTDVRDFDYEVVEFHGELDQSNLGNTEKQIAEVIGNVERKFLVFDLGNLAFVNSEGVGFIAATHTSLVKQERQLIICNAKPNVTDIFELVGLSKLMPVFATIAEAIIFIKKNK